MNKKTLLIITAVISLIVIVVGIEFFVANHSLSRSAAEQNCRGKHENHLVLLNGKTASPDSITAPLCDTVTFKNTDSVTVEIAFGAHDEHQAYDGILEHELAQNESFTIMLNKSGTFHFHDHLRDIIEGHLIVTQ